MRIFVAGHEGMVGNAIFQKLCKNQNCQILSKKKSELNLTDQNAVSAFFKNEKIDSVIICAAKVGGIFANNKYPAEFIYENIQIQSNIIHQAHLSDIQNLIFLGSSCIYPKNIGESSLLKEDCLLKGPFEPTNEPYAIAKVAGIKMCESYNRQYSRDYRSIIPSNLYGPGDNFNLKNSHVIPSLMRKVYEAKLNKIEEVPIWGDGTPLREFLFIDDLAEACIFIMNLDHKTYSSKTFKNQSHINVGSGKEISILDLAELLKIIIDYKGELIFDKSKPNGVSKKLLDINLIKSLGWRPKFDLKNGLIKTFNWFLNNSSSIRR